MHDAFSEHIGTANRLRRWMTDMLAATDEHPVAVMLAAADLTGIAITRLDEKDKDDAMQACVLMISGHAYKEES